MTSVVTAIATAAALVTPSGEYRAPADRVFLSASGRALVIAAYDFRCRATTGRIALNGVALRRVRGRWRLSTRVAASVTYRDDHPDENGRVRLRGTFARDARRVTGTLEVRTRHCGRVGPVTWAARRRPSV